MKVSVIIVTYFSECFIQRCIECVLQSSYKDIEIIVIDNNSKDRTKEILKSFDKKIRCVFLDKNIGFSGANNIGIQHSCGDILFFLNHDAFVSETCIEQLVEYYKDFKNPNIILAPLLLNMDGSTQESCFKFPGIMDILKESLFFNYLIKKSAVIFTPNTNKIISCEGLSGAALMISKNRINEIGHWDENLFWMDDIDLCYRNKISNGQNMILKAASCRHIISGSAKNFPEKVIPYQIVSKLKFFKKHHDFFSQFIIFLLLMLQCFSRILILLLIFIFKKEYAKKLSGYLKASILLIKTLIGNAPAFN